MPTNGMTIDGLNTVSALTAQDKVPVWDNESSGEPTRKITAQNFAAAVKTLASLLGTGDVVNDLNSSETQKPGSANMLRVLAGMIGQIKWMDINGTAYNAVMQDIISNVGTLSTESVVVGIHRASGIRGFIGYLYRDKTYGACIYMEYSGIFKLQYINNGVITSKDINVS